MSKIGRNDSCPCGSEKKYKNCCLTNDKPDISDYSMPNGIIRSDFIKNCIDISKPGFYDDPAFVKIEKKYPLYLNNYARYVQTMEYSSDYLKRAEKEIPLIAKLLHKELLEDGRLGACINVSMLLSKILEVEGFWNYIVKGALTLIYPQESDLGRRYYWPHDFTKAQAGHAWVSAPPYSVVDITLKHQPYEEGEEKYLPDYVIAEGEEETIVEPDDIFSPEAKIFLRRNKGIIESKLLPNGDPELAKVISVFKPYLIKYHSVEMKHITVAIAAPDTPLEEVNTCLKGKNGYAIYRDIIVPALNEYRAKNIN